MLKSLEGTNSLDLQSNENREKEDFNVGFTPWPHFMEFSRLETDIMNMHACIMQVCFHFIMITSEKRLRNHLEVENGSLCILHIGKKYLHFSGKSMN